MNRLTILLTGVSLFATNVMAGSISNVPGTLDTTMVDPAPALYPHFICASGCNSGLNGGPVSQSGSWNVGVSNFPALQAVTGSVSVSGVATAANQPALNLDGGSLAHITNLPSIQSVSGVVTVGNLPATQPVSGSVIVSNLPTSQAVTGTVSVGNFPASQTVTGSIAVPGVATSANQPGLNADGGSLAHVVNWPSSQPISGSVAVSNLPALQPVSGTISVGNFPATQPVSGSVIVSNLPTSQAVTGTVSVGNFPASQTVTGSIIVPGVATSANQPGLNADGGSLAHVVNWPSSQPVSGSVAVSNLPALQLVSGTISVGNFPSSQTVNGAVSVPGVATAANQPGLNTDGGELAHVTNWPSFQPVTGSVAVSNLPTVQPVSGTISIGNLPATQVVSGTVNIGNSVGFGAAGTPSTSVESVQGVTGGAALAVTEADGSNATLGSKADTASSSGSASVVALLKQLHLDDSGATPAGTNTIGAVNLGAQTVFDLPVVSAAIESSHVFKTSGGQLTSAYVVSTVAGYLMLFNATSAPADGGVTPVECVPVPANVATGVAFSGLPPETYNTGITAVFSTTGCFTKAASATAFFHGAVQ